MRRRRTVELVGEQVVRRNQVKAAGFQRETAVERAEFAAPLRDVVAAEVRIFHKRAQRPVILVPGAADLPQLQVEPAERSRVVHGAADALLRRFIRCFFEKVHAVSELLHSHPAADIV